MDYNPQQLAAIEHQGGTLLLSAGAGSGKTAVLAARIARLALLGVPVENMLVVTFTNAAAAEMKRRVRLRLSEAAEDDSLPPAARQNARAALVSLSSASVCTLHAFCTSVLRRHFAACGLDPAFRAADDFESGALAAASAREAIAASVVEGEPGFLAFYDGFGGRNGRALPDLLLSAWHFLTTRTDIDGFLDSALQKFETSPEELAASPAAQTILNHYARRCAQAAGILRTAAAELPKTDEGMAVSELLFSDADALAALSAALRGGAATLADLASYKFPRLSFKRDSALPKERIKAARNRAKALVFPESLKVDARLADGAFQSSLLSLQQPQAEAFVNLIRRFRSIYSTKKEERGIVDFSDMEQLALKALSDPEIAKEYQRRFTHIFIDEYQDSSEIQEAIIGTFSAGKDVFLVGDVKQSIYSFRAANPKIFLKRARRAKLGEGRVLPLNVNYRTSPSLLRCVNDLFSRVMTGAVAYEQDDALHPGRPEGCKTPLNVRVIWGETNGADSIEAEARLVAQLIKERMKRPIGEGSAARMPAFEDFCILLRTVSSIAEIFCQVLAAEGIPAFADLTGGYFDAIEVQVLLNLLRLVDDRRQDVALLSVLRAGIGGFSDSDLAQIRIRAKKRWRDWEPEATDDEPVSYYEALTLCATEGADALSEKCAAFLAFLDEAREESRILPLSRFCEWIIRRTAYDDAVAVLSGGETRLANVRRFLDQARAYESGSPRGLSGFLAYLDGALSAGKDLGSSTVGGAGCVRVMSVHRSKGLEFPIVFLCCANRQYNAADSRKALLWSARGGLCMRAYHPDERATYETLFHRAAVREQEDALREEELRVLYVALTRAREELTVIGTSKDLEKDAASWADPDGGPAKSHLEVILRATADFSEAAELFAQAGVYLPRRPSPHDGDWAFHLHEAQTLLGAEAQEESRERFAAWAESAKSADPSEFSARLWQFSPGRTLPAKVAATALLAPEKASDYSRVPRFATGEKLTAAQKGVAVHALLRHVELHQEITEAYLKARLEELVQREMIA
ncbi:MAG: UvrD-helicase domain-containing protein, partial [Christensenellales bacterium]